MPTEDMPITAYAILFLAVCAVGIIGALFVILIMSAVYRERRDIRRAKAIAKAKKEMKARNLRLKEEEARKSFEDDTRIKMWEEFVNGL